jgi:hypothetical protein
LAIYRSTSMLKFSRANSEEPVTVWSLLEKACRNFRGRSRKQIFCRYNQKATQNQKRQPKNNNFKGLKEAVDIANFPQQQTKNTQTQKLTRKYQKRINLLFQ